MERPRLAEVVGVLSLATDVAMGMPPETGLGTCLIATRLAGVLGCTAEERREAFHLALLRHIGCTAGANDMAALLGDEIAFHERLLSSDLSQGAVAREVLRTVLRDESPLGKLSALVRVATSARRMREGSVGICEVAGRLAAELGFPAQLQARIGEVYERWDGKGFPRGIPAEQVGVTARVVAVAECAEVLTRLESTESAVATVRRRAGTAYDPQVAEAFAASADELLGGLQRGDAWGEMLVIEPEPHVRLDDEELEQGLAAVADFADLVSPFTVGHSRGVAALAAAAGAAAGLPHADCRLLRHAALVHDLGRVGVSASVWGKDAELTRHDWERIRMHPYTTARVLDRAESLRPAGLLAAAHHERLDGSGYHRGLPAQMLTRPARLLQAADAFHAMTEPRPHRPPRAPHEAAAELRLDVRAGRLDADAAEAVLAAAGQPGRRRRAHVAGLTARELDVLRLVARGLSIRQIAAELVVAPKTVDAHIQHIYGKTGVSTRAAATLWAAQHDLLETL